MDRDFDKEKITDKMRTLRDKRDLEILNSQLEETNIDSDYQKKSPKDKVLNVKYLGKVKFKETIDGKEIEFEKDIYSIIEQKEGKDGNLIQIERYCDEDGNVLAGNNDSDQYNYIILSEEYKDRDGLLEQLESLDKEGILDLNDIDQERLEELARVLGVTVRELRGVSEIEADEEIDEDLEEKDEKQEDRKKDQNDEKETLSKKEVEKISTKTEISTGQKVTDKDTMASLLKVQDKGYKKIAVIYSDKLNDKNSTKFSFVGIKEDGSAEKIDTLEQRYGTNPTKKVNSLNRDGTDIEEKQVQSMYQIKGENEKQVAVNIGSMGTIETSLVRTPSQDNEEAISIPIETQAIRPTTRETRELMNEQRNPRVKEEIERIKEHREVGCDDISIKNINDNPNDDTHTHKDIEISEEYLDKLADKVLENDEIASVYNRQDVKYKLKDRIKDGNVDHEQILEELSEEMQKSAEEEHQYTEHERY